ncbi:hypothetical protein Xekk_04486 [Xenorhabdus sp. KK7.4]|nr:hypothetical protein Xekk_04486 [Xenorhabdus sp. KK7.4]
MHGQASLPPDHLHRLAQALPADRRAQNIVAVNHLLQGVQKVIPVNAGVEGQYTV